MIRKVEALHYRCLRNISLDLDPFQVLVGPNASGKSTFIDIPAFLQDLLQHGLLQAVQARASNFHDLFWMKSGDRFELAMEIEIPEERLKRLSIKTGARARYEIAVGSNPGGELSILAEALWLKPKNGSAKPPEPAQRLLFPAPTNPPSTMILTEYERLPTGGRKILGKDATGNAYFYSETTQWKNPFKLGAQKLALANLPEDEERFPVATWVKRFLMEGVQWLSLNSAVMRNPSPPGSPQTFQTDGSNLPWAIQELRQDPDRFGQWIHHVQTALPDLVNIETVERPEDRHRYLVIEYRNGLKAPSWVASDGTLRLLALTLLAYLDTPPRVYLVEEPENGIHPQAVETVFQSLKSSYDNQVFLATHSPVILSRAEPREVLCFAKDATGASDIVRGDEHPLLRNWQKKTDLGTLFATGVLG